MKLMIPLPRTKLFRLGAILLAATPAFAIFGIPDLVFDPSVFGQTVTEVEQAIQMVTTAKASLAEFKANLKSISRKSLWQPPQGTILNDNVQNSYGETAGWSTALNQDAPAVAQSAWTLANLQVQAGTYLAEQMPGNSADLASLAMIEAFDASSPNCLNSVGQYRALRTANADAQSSLATQQLDTTTDTNTEIEQLNLLNASDAQQMQEQQAQGQLHACLAEQTMIANMSQRNVAAQTINDAALVQQQHDTNNVMFANESNTWQNYVP